MSDPPEHATNGANGQVLPTTADVGGQTGDVISIEECYECLQAISEAFAFIAVILFLFAYNVLIIVGGIVSVLMVIGAFIVSIDQYIKDEEIRKQKQANSCRQWQLTVVEEGQTGNAHFRPHPKPHLVLTLQRHARPPQNWQMSDQLSDCKTSSASPNPEVVADRSTSDDDPSASAETEMTSLQPPMVGRTTQAISAGLTMRPVPIGLGSFLVATEKFALGRSKEPSPFGNVRHGGTRQTGLFEDVVEANRLLMTYIGLVLRTGSCLSMDCSGKEECSETDEDGRPTANTWNLDIYSGEGQSQVQGYHTKFLISLESKTVSCKKLSADLPEPNVQREIEEDNQHGNPPEEEQSVVQTQQIMLAPVQRRRPASHW